MRFSLRARQKKQNLVFFESKRDDVAVNIHNKGWFCSDYSSLGSLEEMKVMRGVSHSLGPVDMEKKWKKNGH